jgi:hypothetical protein
MCPKNPVIDPKPAYRQSKSENIVKLPLVFCLPLMMANLQRKHFGDTVMFVQKKPKQVAYT